MSVFICACNHVHLLSLSISAIAKCIALKTVPEMSLKWDANIHRCAYFCRLFVQNWIFYIFQVIILINVYIKWFILFTYSLDFVLEKCIAHGCVCVCAHSLMCEWMSECFFCASLRIWSLQLNGKEKKRLKKKCAKFSESFQTNHIEMHVL